ncbi:hypothetical protein QFZ42_002789 [Variovorax paradoxus]|uniref:hypothetical protein n=1 Tax=Variovorax paradoxus TaxID=34073 RepID=UPI002792DFE2|nr:hypothetical protein [Variovorax paradoxus]MDQ0570955.1 hypothetical protein [Variovorax paradoxus]
MTDFSEFRPELGRRFRSERRCPSTECQSKRHAMKSLVHASGNTQPQKPLKSRSMWAMIWRGFARVDETQRAKERRVLERTQQLARLEQMEIDQLVREVGEW